MPTTTTTTGLSLRQLAERDERIFPSYPQVTRYFPAASIEDARSRIGRAVERGDGPSLVIGGPGTGKSLLLQVLASQYHERFDVVLPACARLCTRRALLQSILFELGLPYRVRDEGDLRLSLLDHLLSREECPTGLLLLVDEAQTLSISLLDELRVLTNLVRGGLPRVRLVLAGSSALEESFAHPELESFSQRLSARCYLGPFGREETAQFVRAQITASGAAPAELFAADAWEAIFDATDGVPRLVNQLCDRALIEANSAGRPRIDGQTIQVAWADIQQLPAPWDTPAPTTSPAAPLSVVEFGSLSESKSEHRVPPMNTPVIEQFDDEELELLDTDLTELDCAEEEFANRRAEEKPAAVAAAYESNTVNPFAEKFDEEEVVLDNFASWDDMFRHEAPRVQNRRDPEFAALVQAAMTTAGVGEEIACAPACAPFRMLDADDVDDTLVDLQSAEPDKEDATNWPPLRLAVVSDSAPLPTDSNGNAEPTWAQNDLAQYDDVSDNSNDEEPVLIVEDDTALPNSPVRREEYRNLFSRLRSG